LFIMLQNNIFLPLVFLIQIIFWVYLILSIFFLCLDLFKTSKLYIYIYNLNIYIYIIFFFFFSSFYSSFQKINTFFFSFELILIILMIIFFFTIKNYLIKKNLSLKILILLNYFVFFSCCLLFSSNIISFYFFLEIISFTTIFLIVLFNKKLYNIEAGLKYFVINAITSSFFLIGLGFIYHNTGLYTLTDSIFYYKQNYKNNIDLYGFFFIILSSIFKLGIYPFMTWIIDIYQGAEIIITFFLSSIQKLIYLYFFFKFLALYLNFIFDWEIIKITIIFVSLCTIIIGNLGIFYQIKIKKYFIWSSFIHSGFLSISFLSKTNIIILLFFSLFYIFFIIHIFNIIINSLFLIYEKEIIINNILEFKYICQKNNFWYFNILLIFFNFAGFPPIIGFFIKFFSFTNIFYLTLILLFIGLLQTSSILYYIRIINILNFFSIKNLKLLTYEKNINYYYISLNIFIYIWFIFDTNIIWDFLLIIN
jgi:NADH-quinone oxidoreductase subunit N